MPNRQLSPEEQAAQAAAEQAAAEQARADALAREQAGAPPAKADASALEPAAAPASAAKAASYDVLHGMVGEWPQGSVITADDLEAANVDERGVQRLLDLEAIAPHTDKE
jgi:membrane protein involved in colicin uptake